MGCSLLPRCIGMDNNAKWQHQTFLTVYNIIVMQQSMDVVWNIRNLITAFLSTEIEAKQWHLVRNNNKKYDKTKGR